MEKYGIVERPNTANEDLKQFKPNPIPEPSPYDYVEHRRHTEKNNNQPQFYDHHAEILAAKKEMEAKEKADQMNENVEELEKDDLTAFQVDQQRLREKNDNDVINLS